MTILRPISEAPLARRQGHYRDDGMLTVLTKPMTITGLTASGDIVMATYRADGDYEDRWVDDATGEVVTLTHFV